MDAVGVLAVCYGSRGAAWIDALSRSESYEPEFYIVDKQRNPFNVARAAEHVVVSDLSVPAIVDFAKKHKDTLDFAVIGPEGPVIAGVRDELESQLGLPTVCPTKKFALEESKVAQRELFAESYPKANPRFRVFKPAVDGSLSEVKSKVYSWLDEMDDNVAVKPDRPGYGKGVGVWGDHFKTREDVWQHFATIYPDDSVIIEEKVDGEESSFQCFTDGRHLVAFPETRDYKRAFDGDLGPNTGGMGCYSDADGLLPFLSKKDYDVEERMVRGLFDHLKGGENEPGLRGISFYVAFIHTDSGPKILEINSRGGDPEIQNILTLADGDLVDACYKMIDGDLTNFPFKKKASVLTYKVPYGYGGFDRRFPDSVDASQMGTPVDLSGLERLQQEHDGSLYAYPGSMELRDDGKIYPLSSRAISVIAHADAIEDARQLSLEGIAAIKGGGLWHRTDIASNDHIKQSIDHMKRIRG